MWTSLQTQSVPAAELPTADHCISCQQYCISVSVHYVIMLRKYETRHKMLKIGWFGVVRGSPKVIENSAIRYSAYEFLLAFHSNCVPILHRFRDIARYWSKSVGSNIPHLYLAPPLGVMSLRFRGDFWHRKTRVPGLSYGVVSVILGLAIFVQLRLVTDGQTHNDS